MNKARALANAILELRQAAVFMKAAQCDVFRPPFSEGDYELFAALWATETGTICSVLAGLLNIVGEGDAKSFQQLGSLLSGKQKRRTKLYSDCVALPDAVSDLLGEALVEKQGREWGAKQLRQLIEQESGDSEEVKALLSTVADTTIRDKARAQGFRIRKGGWTKGKPRTAKDRARKRRAMLKRKHD